MADDADTQVIDAPLGEARMGMPPGAPKPPGRGGPGWAPVVVLAIVALAAIVGGAWAFAERQDARDELADTRDDLAAARDESSSGSRQASDQIDELKTANAKLTAQLKRARADLAVAKKSAATDEAAASSDDSLVAAAKAEVTSMLDATGAGCADYTVIGRSDAGDYGVVRADWNAGRCSSNYETLEFLFVQDGSSWDRVPLTAHPVGEPDIDTGAICNQVISGVGEDVKAKITQACH
jgi:hypothetical protein